MNPARLSGFSPPQVIVPEPRAEVTAVKRTVWIRRLLGLAITVAIFVWICKPIIHNWDHFKGRVDAVSWSRLGLASAMFAAFLFTFRAMSWRRILIGFGHRLPVAAATRIWATSEMARYLPGVIWQVVGRAFLVKPYGVSGSVCSASQVLELVIFLLANALVAISCLLWNGTKYLTGPAREWLFCAMALVPILLSVLHPKIFYGTMNRVLRRLDKPQMTRQLGFAALAGLVLWAAVGLIWQGLAIWVLAAPPLELQFTKWWVVTGAYSLAWCAGFLAFWAPGGIGVRELVFVTAMRWVLPPRIHFVDANAMLGFLAFLSVLLRLWATLGELILSGFAYALDMKGAMGRVDVRNDE